MINSPQEILDRGVVAYFNDNLELFVDSIIELESIISCDCFYDKQPSELWQRLKDKMNTSLLRHSIPSYLSAGFISLRVKDYKNAKTYFQYATSLGYKNDFMQVLNFQVQDFNHSLITSNGILSLPTYVKSNKSPRFLYYYSKCVVNIAKSTRDERLKVKCLEIALDSIKEANLIYPDIKCFYEQEGLIYFESGEMNLAHDAFSRKGICNNRLNDTPFSLFMRAFCLYNLNQIKESKELLKVGIDVYSQYPDFNYLYGTIIYTEWGPGSAMVYFGKYLSGNGKSDYLWYSNENIKKAKILYLDCKNWFSYNRLKDLMIKHFKLGSYIEVVNLYKESKLDFSDFELNLDEEIGTSLYQEYHLKVLGIHGIFGEALLALYSPKFNYKNFFSATESRITSIFSDDLNYSKHSKLMLKLNSKHQLKFGRYKSKTIEDVMSIDPGYIIWCIINVNEFSIEYKLMLDSQLQITEGYFDALRMNTLKNTLIPKMIKREREIEDNLYYSDLY